MTPISTVKATGKTTLYAFPGGVALSTWSTNRRLLTETATGYYTTTVDETIGSGVWYLFEGSSQPASYNDGLNEIFDVAGSGGSTDWTVDERTAIRSILGVPESGTIPTNPITGILDTIRDQFPTNFLSMEIDTNGKVLLQPSQPGVTIPTVTALTNAPTSGDLTATMKASVNTEIDTALTDIHLDHLLAADYNPASKPGVATALLNELIESDAGVSRYTANALEQGPSGGGGGGTVNITVEDSSITIG